MGDGFLGKEIRRAGRNRILVGLGGLFFVAALFWVEGRYLHNFFHGPFPTDQATVLSIQDPDARRDSFLTIQGDETFDTGFEETDTEYFITRHHPLLLTKIGDRLLLVKAPRDTEATTFSGELTSVPSNIQSQVLQVLEKKYPDMKGQYLPLLLDATNYRFEGYVGIPIGILFALALLWYTSGGTKWYLKPETHLVWGKLGAYGTAQRVGAQLDAEMRSEGGGTTVGDARLTTNWLVHSSGYNVEIIRLADLAWAYQHVVKHYHAGIPTGKSFFVKAFDREGASIQIAAKKNTAPELLQSLQLRSPWAVFGFSAELEQLWTKRREEFLLAIDQRKGRPQAAPAPANSGAEERELVHA